MNREKMTKTIVLCIVSFLVISCIYVAIISYLGKAYYNSSASICQENRNTLYTLTLISKGFGFDCSLEEVVDGSCAKHQEAIKQLPCPNDGVFFIKNQKINCTFHNK